MLTALRHQVLSTTDRRLTHVYIALGDDGRVVAKFSEFCVWGKVPERSTLIFGDALTSLKHSVE